MVLRLAVWSWKRSTACIVLNNSSLAGCYNGDAPRLRPSNGHAAPRRVEVTVHCVAPSLDAFEGLRVAATLYAATLADADGAEITAAEPARIKTDVWMAADTAGLPDRASAGFGGSAKVCLPWSSSVLHPAVRSQVLRR